MATEQERQLLASKMLAAVGNNAAKLPKSKVTGFLAMVGHLYEKKLMVAGRCVNGWIEGILPEHLALPAEAESYSSRILKSVSGDPCPMKWVADHYKNPSKQCNLRQSAFWRTIRDVVGQLDIADVEQDSWPCHLVWSNLYKVAPAEGGNPGGALCQAQQAGCKALFKQELKTYTPSRLLLLTGMGWAWPFLSDFDYMSQSITGYDYDYVEGFGTLSIDPAMQPISYLVAVHPQGKPEEQWISEVCSVFERI